MYKLKPDDWTGKWVRLRLEHEGLYPSEYRNTFVKVLSVANTAAGLHLKFKGTLGFYEQDVLLCPWRNSLVMKAIRGEI